MGKDKARGRKQSGVLQGVLDYDVKRPVNLEDQAGSLQY